ncbi:HlyD family efflux transporter periplasmic adaptor subunit [Aedoeadaptatus pacaensis]|uniref:HlyD family efflux transporter periplasmic adaptor subunit n=1 Tax=Aedoeadaptatus pacaensis TaxID=1776390 RepID=UPI000AF8ECF2|nr:HlyD family efflux transporter periplasmic adaptor subunit [Peptoniphilus pacaensis]
MTQGSNVRNKIRRRQNRKRKRRRLLLLIPLLLILLGGVYSIYDRLVFAPKTAKPTEIQFRDVAKGDGYLLFDEDTVFTKAGGTAVYNVREGKKVPKGFRVADINVMNDNSKVKDQLIRIQAAIDFKNDRTSEKSKDTVDEEYENVIRNIQRFIRDEDYEKLVSSINTLDLSTKHTVNVSELNELLKLSIPALEEQKDVLTERIASTSADYTAPASGIISYTFDDLKKDLSLEKDDETFTRSYLKAVDVAPLTRGKNHVKEGQAFFRSICDTRYKIALPIDDERLVKDQIKQTVTVRIGKVYTQAQVEKVLRDEKGAVVILNLQDKLQEVYTPRRQKITIIKSQSRALRIPTTAIVKGKHGEDGVYVDEIRRFVSFVPVQVLSVRGKDAYISMGGEDATIKNKKGKYVTTVQPNDDVIVEPKKVEKNKIVY